MADLRRELLAPMTGEVVEVGAGSGPQLRLLSARGQPGDRR